MQSSISLCDPHRRRRTLTGKPHYLISEALFAELVNRNLQLAAKCGGIKREGGFRLEGLVKHIMSLKKSSGRASTRPLATRSCYTALIDTSRWITKA
jgi:hypothetical protein